MKNTLPCFKMKSFPSIKALVILVLFFMSCSSAPEDARLKILEGFDTWRERNMMHPFNSKLILDSTVYFTGFEIEGSYSGKRFLESDTIQSYRVREYYTSSDMGYSNYMKILHWNVDSGRYSLEQEWDKYTKKNYNGFDIDLNLVIGENFEDNPKYRTYLQVDSVPTAELLHKVIVEEDMIPKEGYEICGTAYFAFYNTCFPKRNAILDTNKVAFYLQEFRKR